MAFLNKLFGYPNDRLTLIDSFKRQEDGVMKFISEYRMGQFKYTFELRLPGKTPEEWAEDALQMQYCLIMLYKEFGPLLLTMANHHSFDRELPYKHMILNRIENDISDDTIGMNKMRVNTQLIITTDKEVLRENRQVISDGLLEYLKGIGVWLVQKMIDNNNL